MREKYLPIGSIVLLKNMDIKIMVSGFLVTKLDDNSKVYDYTGSIYPQGFISNENHILFDHDDIDEIIFVGYEDDEHLDYNEYLNDINVEEIFSESEENTDEMLEESEENIENIEK